MLLFHTSSSRICSARRETARAASSRSLDQRSRRSGFLRDQISGMRPQGWGQGVRLGVRARSS